MISDTIKGLPCIRSFNIMTTLKKNMNYLVEEQGKNILADYAIGKWFKLWLQISAIAMIQLPAYILVIILFEIGTDNAAGVAM